jgi:hypothetical protein
VASTWGDSWGIASAWGDSWGANAPAPTVTDEIPGGHRRKDQDSDHLRKRKKKDEYEPVKTRDLTDDEKAALEEGFRELHPTSVPVIPDAVPVYVAPRDPVGLGPALRKAVSPEPTSPSVVGAIFDTTATPDQRAAAFTVFDRLDAVLERDATVRRSERRAQHDASLRYAADLAARQHAERTEAERQKAQAEEDELVALLLALHEADL